LDSVGQLNSILSDPTEAGAGPKFDAAIAALKQIGTDAPADVRNAAAHLTGALAKGKTEIVGGHPDLGDIGMLATTVATDNRVLVDYVIKDCSGS
jgi:hydroxymethylpyrimidine/phosphomethylpyrimidine kinase